MLDQVIKIKCCCYWTTTTATSLWKPLTMLTSMISSCFHFHPIASINCSHLIGQFRVYGPFKRYYNSACGCWMKENRGKTMTIYDIPDMVGRAFPRAFTPVNIQSSFKVTRIFPFDCDIFSDLEFLLSDVTDRLVPSADTDNLTQSKHQQLLNEQPQVLERPSSSTNQFILNVTPENIRPFTKAAPRKRKSCTNRGKTRILTDTPEKNQIITKAEKKEYHPRNL